MTPLHATAVARRTPEGPRAVLLLGASGAGKSLLAASLAARGWMLVADDRVVLRRHRGAWCASPPPALAGLHEIRGAGVRPAPHLPIARLALVLGLGAPPERVPTARPWRDAHADAPAPDLPYIPFNAAAPAAADRLEAAFTEHRARP